MNDKYFSNYKIEFSYPDGYGDNPGLMGCLALAGWEYGTIE
jgi:hypothetical protein